LAYHIKDNPHPARISANRQPPWRKNSAEEIILRQVNVRIKCHRPYTYIYIIKYLYNIYIYIYISVLVRVLAFQYDGFQHSVPCPLFDYWSTLPWKRFDPGMTSASRTIRALKSVVSPPSGSTQSHKCRSGYLTNFKRANVRPLCACGSWRNRSTACARINLRWEIPHRIMFPIGPRRLLDSFAS